MLPSPSHMRFPDHTGTQKLALGPLSKKSDSYSNCGPTEHACDKPRYQKNDNENKERLTEKRASSLGSIVSTYDSMSWEFPKRSVGKSEIENGEV